MSRRENGELFALAVEEWIGANHKPSGLPLLQGGKDRFEIGLCACVQYLDLQVEGAACRLQVLSERVSAFGLVGLMKSQRSSLLEAVAAVAPGALAPIPGSSSSRQLDCRPDGSSWR